MSISRDDFEYWLFEMDGKLSKLMTLLPQEVVNQLDYTDTSLLALEGWLLDTYTSMGDILKNSNKELLDCLSCYVGETLRKNLGGKWNIDLLDKKNVYFATPVVEKLPKWTESPVSMITASIDRKRGNYMHSIYGALASRT